MFETFERTIELEGRTLVYDVTGDGPPIVFVQGVWATGGIWYPVIERLATEFRCINLHLPLGVHRYPSRADVDRSPRALARIVAGLMNALDLHDVTLVGNDTGGAICQLVVAHHPERLGRLVLTNCDAFEVFPPDVLAPLYAAARLPPLWWAFSQLLRLPRVRRRFASTVAHTPPDPATSAMLFERFAGDAAVREDLRRTILAIAPQVTLDAATSFANFRRDVLVLWGADDRFFPVALGRRLAAAFPRATFELVERAKLFVGLDRPDRVSDAIRSFVRSSRATSPAVG